MNVIELKPRDIGDLPRGLRDLADEIEAGDYGTPDSLVWVLDRNGIIDVGMIGHSPEPGAVAHLLLHMAARKLEG